MKMWLCFLVLGTGSGHVLLSTNPSDPMDPNLSSYDITRLKQHLHDFCSFSDGVSNRYNNARKLRVKDAAMGSSQLEPLACSDLSPPRARLLRCIYRERAAISLFDALNANSSGAGAPLTFPESTIAEVSQTLARFRSIAVDDYRVPLSQVSVFATEAMRRAANAGAMLDAIKAAAPGFGVQILAPEVETLFGAMGARSGFVDVKGLFLDLGGGSVQMTYMDSSSDVQPSYEIAAAQAGESLPFGAARLIRVLETASADVKAIEEAKLGTGMARAFSVLKEKFPGLAETGNGGGNEGGVDIYLCGGGFRGYGSILMHNDPIQPYPIPFVGAYTVSGELFKDTKTMRKVNAEYESKIFGMSKRRRHQFPAIATVIEALIQAVPDIKSVTFCAGGNREGALALKLPRDVRESSPLPLLASPDVKTDSDSKTTKLVLDSISSAMPTDKDTSHVPSIFNLGLAPLFAQEIWARSGEEDDSNAAHALHETVNGYPSSPGLTHLARAVLGLTLCARWGGGLAPIDVTLYRNLKALVERVDPEARFWAEYIGATAAALARVVPAWPAGRSVLDMIRFETKNKGNKIELKILVASDSTRGISPADLSDVFKNVGRSKLDNKRADKKVLVTVEKLGI